MVWKQITGAIKRAWNKVTGLIWQAFTTDNYKKTTFLWAARQNRQDRMEWLWEHGVSKPCIAGAILVTAARCDSITVTDYLQRKGFQWDPHNANARYYFQSALLAALRSSPAVRASNGADLPFMGLPNNELLRATAFAYQGRLDALVALQRDNVISELAEQDFARAADIAFFAMTRLHPVVTAYLVDQLAPLNPTCRGAIDFHRMVKTSFHTVRSEGLAFCDLTKVRGIPKGVVKEVAQLQTLAVDPNIHQRQDIAPALRQKVQQFREKVITLLAEGEPVTRTLIFGIFGEHGLRYLEPSPPQARVPQVRNTQVSDFVRNGMALPKAKELRAEGRT